MRLYSLLLGFTFALFAPPGATAATIERGALHGAAFTLALPDGPALWNRQILLIAHGYRPVEATLVADLSLSHAAYRTLVDEGWAVAKTSYRRNGIIVDDGIADLDNLLEELARRLGPPQRVIVEGDSMGGLIAALLAERGQRVDGAIAIGAALDLREPGGTSGLNFNPKIPLLFVANRSEIAGPIAYLNTAIDRAAPNALDPVLFRVDRDGHVNVNQAERLYTIRQLNLWLDQGRDALPTLSRQDNSSLAASYHDATKPARPQPSRVAFDADRLGFRATVADVSAIYGNVWLDIQPADFAAIGLESGSWFQLTAHSQTFRVRFGGDFSSVERGQWVAFPNADGFFWIARNYANAAETAALAVGDEVQIRRFDDEEPKPE